MSSGHTEFNPNYKEGLSEKEVLIRKNEGLINIVTDKITKTNGQIIKENLFTLFNIFNFAIAIALALVGAYSNLFFIVIILINIFTGMIQELNAKKMIENLSILSSSKAKVIRDGKESSIEIEEIVLDDIIIFEMGNQISADSVVMSGEIEVNEALLTGESEPIIKKVNDTLLSGSFVISGKCFAKVLHVGEDNFATKLALEAKKTKTTNSVLLGSIRKIIKFTSFFIVPIGILLFVEAYFLRNQSVNISVITSSTALLGMLPKGLVLLISISLISGIIVLSRKKVLVQDLYSLENLARIDVLCLDKTGTLTEGKISVSDVFPINENILPISIDKMVGCFINSVDDNNSTFVALKEHFKAENLYKVESKIPFSSERKWSSVKFEKLGTLIVGAPEKLTKTLEKDFPSEVLEAQKDGKRILYLGFSIEDIVNGILPKIEIIGAIFLKDSVRENVKETLDFFKTQGVSVKIISGDNPITVSNIARQSGLTDYDSYIDLSLVSTTTELEKVASEYSVFGRINPSQKRDIVKIFQKQGHTVAMVGDGVNDVLALKEADCSIAMASGSDAAKQVSQLVLLDSNFSVLPDIVMEGRRVVNNITKVGGIFLIKTLYSIILSIICLIGNVPFPFIPIQITLIDMIVEGYPSFFMQFEENHNKIKEPFLGSVIKKALPYSMTIILSIVAIYFISPFVNILENQNVMMYYITAFITIMAVFFACIPFNKFRAFLSFSTLFGFYLATFLFSNILKLNPMSSNEIIFCIIISLISLPVIKVFKILIKIFFSKKSEISKQPKYS